MMKIIHSLVPKMEVNSIDEAFIDFSGIQEIDSLAHKIRKELRQYLGIAASIGIGSIKTLAKVANYFAKRIAYC